MAEKKVRGKGRKYTQEKGNNPLERMGGNIKGQIQTRKIQLTKAHCVLKTILDESILFCDG